MISAPNYASGAGAGCRNPKGRLGLRCSGRGRMMMVVVVMVPRKTQWFSWSLSLWKMAISLGIWTQHFQTNPHYQVIVIMIFVFIWWVPVQFVETFHPCHPLSHIYTTYFQIHLQIVAGDAAPQPAAVSVGWRYRQDFSSQLGFGWETQDNKTPTRDSDLNGGIVWIKCIDQMEPDGFLQFERQHFSICSKCI